MARVMLVHQPTAGGVGRHVSDLATALRGAGHEVILCGPAAPDMAPEGCRHVSLALQRAVSPRADARAVRRLVSLVGRLSPDLVHAHSSKAGAVARLARIAHPGVPIVYSPHGYAFAGHFERERERALYRQVERGLSPLASRIICVCDAEAQLARRLGADSRVRVVHNGVAPVSQAPPVDPAMAKLRRAGPVICTLTQLRPGKGLETLLDAMPAVLSAHGCAQLAIWGDGPGLPALRARAGDLGISGNVLFPGATTTPLNVMSGADIFTFPSLAEAFPYVILEAMSVACPIVSSDVGGIGEALDPATGVLVTPSDPAALASALISLLADPGRARRLGAAAQTRVARMFPLRKMLTQTVEVYTELMPDFLDGARPSPV